LVEPATAPPPPPPPPPPAPPPSSGGFPGPDNTGPPAGTQFTQHDVITVTQDGAVLNAVDANRIEVTADNVTIRNSIIRSSNIYLVRSRGTGLVIEDSIIDGQGGSFICVSPNNFTLRRVEIAGCEDGLRIESPGNVQMFDSWIHDLRLGQGDHSDGVSLSGGAANVVLRGNNIDPMPAGATGATSAIIMYVGTGTQNSRVWVENNRLDGQGTAYALYCPRQATSDVFVRDNRIVRGAFGYTDGCGTQGVTYSGNVDDVTRQLLSGQDPPAPLPPPLPPAPPPPPSGAWPVASNTGPSGTLTAVSGDLTVTQAGAVLANFDRTGSITVNAPNVTIRNCRIRSNAFMVIRSNSTGLVVEDCELLDGPDTGENNCHNAIGFGGFTIRRSEIVGCENAADVGGGNATLADNFIHDLDTQGPSHVWGNSPHTDGIQGTGDNVVVRHNWIDPSPGSGVTAGIIMGTNDANQNYRIEDNYIDGRGASYAIYAPRQQTSGIAINRNRMLRGINYVACVRLGVTVQEFNDNRDHATNAVLSAASMDNGSGCSN
jgi:hypothetical protein